MQNKYKVGNIMKKSIVALSALAAMSTSLIAGGNVAVIAPVVEEPVVVDNSSFYVGLGLSAVFARDSSVSLDFSTTPGQDRLGNVTLQAGYNFNEYIAVEGRYTTSFTHEDNIEMDGWSLFVKPQYPVTEDFNIYALLGFGGINLDSVTATVVDVDDTSFQWGLGASYDITESIAVFADYTNLANDMDGYFYTSTDLTQVDIDTFNVGLTYKF